MSHANQTNMIIKLPNGNTVAMSATQFRQFHEDLTTLYNENYRAIEDQAEREETEPYGVITDEINQDHAQV